MCGQVHSYWILSGNVTHRSLETFSVGLVWLLNWLYLHWNITSRSHMGSGRHNTVSCSFLFSCSLLCVIPSCLFSCCLLWVVPSSVSFLALYCKSFLPLTLFLLFTVSHSFLGLFSCSSKSSKLLVGPLICQNHMQMGSGVSTDQATWLVAIYLWLLFGPLMSEPMSLSWGRRWRWWNHYG